jgi:hypothetical protein
MDEVAMREALARRRVRSMLGRAPHLGWEVVATEDVVSVAGQEGVDYLRDRGAEAAHLPAPERRSLRPGRVMRPPPQPGLDVLYVPPGVLPAPDPP